MAKGSYIARVGIDQRAPYAIWVEEGTGVFGRHGVAITPRAGNVLVFESAGKAGRESRSGHTIFTKSVKGQPGQHFLLKAWEDVMATYAPARIAELGEVIGKID